MKLKLAILGTVLFTILLIIVYFVHISYFKVDVVFYAAIADGVIAATIAGVAIFTIKYFSALGSFEKVLLVVIWLISGYAVAISVPTVIDRSLSFYILEKLQQRGGGIKQDSFETVFTQEYVKEHRLIDVRLTEQLESGTISIENGCVKLTEKGELLVKFSKYFRHNWLPKQRLLMGSYSDDLTDPFRNSQEDLGYSCE